MQFKCNLSATMCDIFDLARNLSHLAAIFAIKLDKKRLCHPCIVVFWRAKMVEKTKQTQKSKKVCWTVEEEELLVELWPNYECLYKTNSPEFKSGQTATAREDIRRRLETELESSSSSSSIFT